MFDKNTVIINFGSSPKNDKVESKNNWIPTLIGILVLSVIPITICDENKIQLFLHCFEKAADIVAKLKK